MTHEYFIFTFIMHCSGITEGSPTVHFTASFDLVGVFIEGSVVGYQARTISFFESLMQE